MKLTKERIVEIKAISMDPFKASGLTSKELDALCDLALQAATDGGVGK